MVGTQVELDTILELCRDEHRRIVLGVLADQRRSLTVNDLTTTIVKHGHQTPLTEISGETTERIRIALHHVHLPKIAEAGLIEYDTERQLVEPTAEFDRIEPLLSAIRTSDSELPTPLQL